MSDLHVRLKQLELKQRSQHSPCHHSGQVLATLN